MPPRIIARLARNGDRLLGKYRGGEEQGPVVLAAIEAMAQPDPMGPPRGRNPNVSAKTPAGHVSHALSPIMGTGPQAGMGQIGPE